MRATVTTRPRCCKLAPFSTTGRACPWRLASLPECVTSPCGIGIGLPLGAAIQKTQTAGMVPAPRFWPRSPASLPARASRRSARRTLSCADLEHGAAPAPAEVRGAMLEARLPCDAGHSLSWATFASRLERRCPYRSRAALVHPPAMEAPVGERPSLVLLVGPGSRLDLCAHFRCGVIVTSEAASRASVRRHPIGVSARNGGVADDRQQTARGPPLASGECLRA
jgi:hypothetical protein